MKTCIICFRPVESYIELGYGSKYDGSIVCDGCLAEHIDPVIDEKRDKRVEILEKTFRETFWQNEPKKARELALRCVLAMENST